MKKVSVVIPCYNEEANVLALFNALEQTLAAVKTVSYEIIFIDNCSKDGTRQILRDLCARYSHVKAIFNLRNFGHIRSPYHGLLQVKTDAAILMAADFQDPPELLPELISKWLEGNKVVLGTKNESEESRLFFWVRKRYYSFVAKISDIDLVKNCTGFGLYDAEVLENLKRINEPYPYFRGLVLDLGYVPHLINFKQPVRKRGVSSQNFWILYDIAILGIISHSKIPLRLATMIGFGFCLLGLLVAFLYLIAKLMFWDLFTLGSAPALIGTFLFSSVQLFFIGVVGEYVGAIYTQVLNRPHVIEAERIGTW